MSNLAQTTAAPELRAIQSIATPFDLPAAEFRAGLDKRAANRAALLEWISAALVATVDFGSVQTKRGLSKPSLLKPGAEKICGMLGVAPSFPSFSDYERAAIDGREIKNIVLRCLLVSATGQVLAEGIGARSVSTDYGDINKSLKMAAKSAHVDATLRLGGLSEVFTQDLEDMAARGMLEGATRATSAASAEIVAAPVQPEPSAAPSAAPRKGPPPGYVADTLSAEHKKRVEAQLRAAGLADCRNRVKDYCAKRWGVDTFGKLSADQAEQLIACFPKMAEKTNAERAAARTAAENLALYNRLVELERRGVTTLAGILTHYQVDCLDQLPADQRQALESWIGKMEKISEPPEAEKLRSQAAAVAAAAAHADDPAAHRAGMEQAAELRRQADQITAPRPESGRVAALREALNARDDERGAADLTGAIDC